MIESAPLLLSSDGYNLNRSVRIRSSATGYFERTPASAGSLTAWTWSGWVKRGALGVESMLFSAGTGGANPRSLLSFNVTTNTLDFGDNATGSLWYELITTAAFRDPAAWYHIVAVYDSANATSTERMRLYVNGIRITSFSTAAYPSISTGSVTNTAIVHRIGRYAGGAETAYFDGYMTEVNFIGGQALTAASFGEFNLYNQWVPKKYAGTYGTNGFYLNFNNNSASTATTIGKDNSGLNNNWTPNNISVTAGSTYDSMTDVPTLTSATAANYCTLNPLYPSSIPVGGNLNVVGDSNSRTVAGTMSSPTGKYYAEGTFTSGFATNGWFFVWDTSTPYVAGNVPATTGQTGAYYAGITGNIVKAITGTITTIGTYSTWTNSDIIGMAFDADAGTISFYKNNTLQVTITDSAFIGRPLTFGIYYYAGSASMNFGQRPFNYTPPTGYLALNTFNL